MMIIREFTPVDEIQVVSLWRRGGLETSEPNLLAQVQHKLLSQPGLFLVGTIHSTIIASAVASHDGVNASIEYLTVAPEWQRLGYGRRMVREMERCLQEAGCRSVKLPVRPGNRPMLGFCERLGYRTEKILSMSKPLAEPARKKPTLRDWALECAATMA